jgi:hypothetical protein
MRAHLLLFIAAVAACHRGGDGPIVPPARTQIAIGAGGFLGTPDRCLGAHEFEPAYAAVDPTFARRHPTNVPLRLGAFAIDRDLVTHGEYRRCVRAGRCPAGDRHQPVEQERHGMAVANHEAAERYCAWRGMRLPAFLEWQRAARGRDGQPYATGWSRPDPFPCPRNPVFEPWPWLVPQCMFESPDGMRYVLHYEGEWTSDRGCAEPGFDGGDLMVRLDDARLDASLYITDSDDVAMFRCVRPSTAGGVKVGTDDHAEAR